MANDTPQAGAAVTAKPRMTGKRLALRAILTLLGTIVILAAFGELRPGRVAQLFGGLFVVFGV
jgi:hypothetical protein